MDFASIPPIPGVSRSSSTVFQTLQEQFRQAHHIQHARSFFLKRIVAPVAGANDLVQVQFRSLFHDVGLLAAKALRQIDGL